MQRPQHCAVAPQLVRVCRHLQRVRVEFNDRVDPFRTLVERLDTSQVIIGQFYGGEPAAGHARLKFRDGRFVKTGGNSCLSVRLTRGDCFLPVRSHCENERGDC